MEKAFQRNLKVLEIQMECLKEHKLIVYSEVSYHQAPLTSFHIMVFQTLKKIWIKVQQDLSQVILQLLSFLQMQHMGYEKELTLDLLGSLLPFLEYEIKECLLSYLLP